MILTTTSGSVASWTTTFSTNNIRTVSLKSHLHEVICVFRISGRHFDLTYKTSSTVTDWMLWTWPHLKRFSADLFIDLKSPAGWAFFTVWVIKQAHYAVYVKIRKRIWVVKSISKWLPSFFWVLQLISSTNQWIFFVPKVIPSIPYTCIHPKLWYTTRVIISTQHLQANTRTCPLNRSFFLLSLLLFLLTRP